VAPLPWQNAVCHEVLGPAFHRGGILGRGYPQQFEHIRRNSGGRRLAGWRFRAACVRSTGRASFNSWHETHNTFTQLSCEDGLPGLFLYCLTLLFCFKIVRSAEKRARPCPALSSVRHMAVALRLSLIAFTGTALFASNAYMYYFPMLAALCVALDRATADLARRINMPRPSAVAGLSAIMIAWAGPCFGAGVDLRVWALRTPLRSSRHTVSEGKPLYHRTRIAPLAIAKVALLSIAKTGYCAM